MKTIFNSLNAPARQWDQFSSSPQRHEGVKFHKDFVIPGVFVSQGQIYFTKKKHSYPGERDESK